MIPTAYDRLKLDANLQEWWQSILDDPRTPLILDAARILLEQQLPTAVPVSSSITEVCAFQHVAREGAKSALKALELLGSAEMSSARIAEDKLRQRAQVDAPSNLGKGAGKRATHTAAGPH